MLEETWAIRIEINGVTYKATLPMDPFDPLKLRRRLLSGLAHLFATTLPYTRETRRCGADLLDVTYQIDVNDRKYSSTAILTTNPFAIREAEREAEREADHWYVSGLWLDVLRPLEVIAPPEKPRQTHNPDPPMPSLALLRATACAIANKFRRSLVRLWSSRLAGTTPDDIRDGHRDMTRRDTSP